MLKILPHIFTLVGSRTVIQVKRNVGDLYQNRVFFLGIIIAIFICFLSIYCDYLSELENSEDPDTYIPNNNILRATDYIGRLMTILQQPLLAVAIYFQSKALCDLLNETAEFDAYLELQMNVNVIARKTVILDRVASVVLIVLIFLNYLGIYWMYKGYYEAELPFFDVYQYMLPKATYLVNVIGTCVYLTGVYMRMCCYNILLRKLLNPGDVIIENKMILA